MSKKWHSGPPPSVGWWPASVTRQEGLFRWWDGAAWSQFAVNIDSPAVAGKIAKKRCNPVQHEYMEWQHRPASWPTRSRT